MPLVAADAGPMTTNPVQPTALSQPSPFAFVLAEAWTATGIGANEIQFRSRRIADNGVVVGVLQRKNCYIFSSCLRRSYKG